MTEATGRRIEKLLTRLLTVLEPKSDKPKPASAASVAAFNTVTGDNGMDVVPSQLEHGMVEAGPMKRARIVTRIK